MPATAIVATQDALDGLELPVRLSRGRIGRLQLRVPWSRLRSEPAELIVEDLELEAYLRDTPDAGAFSRYEQLHKRLRLDAEELLRGLRESAAAAAAGDAAAGRPAASESFLGRLGRAVLDNLRITLHRVNLRLVQRPGASVATPPVRFRPITCPGRVVGR